MKNTIEPLQISLGGSLDESIILKVDEIISWINAHENWHVGAPTPKARQEVPVVEQTEPVTLSYTMAGTLIPKLRSKCCSSVIDQIINLSGNKTIVCNNCNESCHVKIVSEKE